MHCLPTCRHVGPRVPSSPSRFCRFPVDVRRQRVKRRSAHKGLEVAPSHSASSGLPNVIFVRRRTLEESRVLDGDSDVK